MGEIKREFQRLKDGLREASVSRDRFLFFAAFSLTLIISVCFGVFSYLNLQATSRADELKHHTYLVIIELNGLLSSLKDAETGERGFIITGDRKYLEPYYSAITKLDKHLATLRVLTKENPTQQLRLKTIESVVQTKLAQLDETIRARSINGFESAKDLVVTDIGKSTMDALRVQIDHAVREERQLLKDRSMVEKKYFTRNFYFLLLGTFVGITLLLTLYLFLWREVARRVRSELELIASRDLLETQNNELTRVMRDRQEMEALLGKYSDLYDFAPVGYFNLDRSGTIRAVNITGAKMLGEEPSLLVNRNLDLFVSDDSRPVFHDCLDGAFERRITEACEITFQREGAAPIYVQVEAAVSESKGDCRAVIIDISERKRAEQEKVRLEERLHQAQKMESVGQLAGGVAHDFNNMLTVILGHTNLALMDLEPGLPLRTHLEEIRKAAERSANLTRQLLAFARKQVVTPKVLNLNETVAGMLAMLKRLIGENINLNWQPEANLWPVKIDPSQIDQVLANLCANARDSIAEVGTITIETRNIAIEEEYCRHNAEFVPGAYVRLSVSDDGSGMEKEVLAHIFEPFFTTKGIGKGTGLGLATVFGAVKQNNGFINVYSEPNLGTTFNVYLPRYLGNVVQEQGEIAAQPPERGKETILLVEDEAAVMDIARIMLTRQGYTVLAAKLPGEAMQLAKEHAGEISLLMTDVVMPTMSGWDLAKTLISLYPHLKCLFMSGYAADVIAHHEVIGEGVHFIQKPFTRADLAAKVRQVLDSE